MDVASLPHPPTRPHTHPGGVEQPESMCFLVSPFVLIQRLIRSEVHITCGVANETTTLMRLSSLHFPLQLSTSPHETIHTRLIFMLHPSSRAKHGKDQAAVALIALCLGGFHPALSFALAMLQDLKRKRRHHITGIAILGNVPNRVSSSHHAIVLCHPELPRPSLLGSSSHDTRRG